MKRLKVFGWYDVRLHKGEFWQTREVCAAYTKAQVARTHGYLRRYELHVLKETENKSEVKAAMKNPGSIFWRLAKVKGKFKEARRAYLYR